MGIQIKEGGDTLLHIKKGNPPVLVKEERSGSGDFGFCTDEDVEQMSFSDKRSIPLGNYEYAKVRIGISIGLPLDGINQEKRDDAFRRIQEAVVEVISREEALIRGQRRENRKIDLNGVGVKCSIWVGYNLTIKKGNDGTHSPEITSTRYLTDGSDFEEKLDTLTKEVGDRIGEYKTEILNSDS